MSDDVDVFLDSCKPKTPDPICPCCGSPLFPHRCRLVCSNADCPYQETCDDGGVPPVIERDTKSPKK